MSDYLRRLEALEQRLAPERLPLVVVVIENEDAEAKVAQARAEHRRRDAVCVVRVIGGRLN